MQTPPCSLYIHIPWCLQKCVYCDFNSTAITQTADQNKYIKALIQDLKQEVKLLQRKSISSVFIGGGTPTILSAENINKLLNEVLNAAPIENAAEITIEANPETLDKTKLTELYKSGINRISFGVQTFDDQQLHNLNRAHTSSKVISIIQTAQDIGLENINIDLMFGLPKQSSIQMLSDIEKAVELNPKHISHYQLTLESGTPLAAQKPTMPNEDQLASMYAESRIHLAKYGFVNYETSAFAKPGYECKHNLNYWQFGDFIGIGAGAHGKLTNGKQIIRYSKPNEIQSYIEQVENQKSLLSKECLSQHDTVLDFMINAMRLNSGWNKQLFIDRTGVDFSIIEPKLNALSNSGLISFNGNQIQPTSRGKMLLDEILAAFV